MAGERYDGGGIGGLGRGHPRRQRRRAPRPRPGAGRRDARAQGTTTVEIKSGYGLTVDDEARSLRIAAEFTPETTYLGAHVVPADYAGDRAAYLDLVTGPMLEAAAPYARWIDVFCEPHSAHAFTEDEARAVLMAGRDAGLGLRVHGNQLGPGPGVQLAVELGAASVDHCTYLSRADVEALASAAGTTVATLLPGVEFSTRSPYPDARRLLDAGCSVALATDCNPGTCYSSSMPFVIALAVREMGMTPGEAVYAATAGSAMALRRRDVGRIEVGARADLAVLDAPSHLHLSYRAGVPIARTLELPGQSRQPRRPGSRPRPPAWAGAGGRSTSRSTRRPSASPAPGPHPRRDRSVRRRRRRPSTGCGGRAGRGSRRGPPASRPAGRPCLATTPARIADPVPRTRHTKVPTTAPSDRAF